MKNFLNQFQLSVAFHIETNPLFTLKLHKKSDSSAGSFLGISKNNCPFDIYLFRVINGNTRTTCQVCSKLTIMTPEKTSSVFIFVLWTIFTYGSVVSIFAFEQVTTNGCDYFSEVSLWSWSEHYFKIHRKTTESQSFSIKLQPFSLQFY